MNMDPNLSKVNRIFVHDLTNGRTNELNELLTDGAIIVATERIGELSTVMYLHVPEKVPAAPGEKPEHLPDEAEVIRDEAEISEKEVAVELQRLRDLPPLERAKRIRELFAQENTMYDHVISEVASW